MKNNQILNKRGFVLAETLVVAVAISTIFALVFRNFYPLMGEYEKREYYDDIDSKYGTYWIKKMIQSCDYNFSTVDADIAANGYSQFSCNNISNATTKNMCIELVKKLEVSCDNSSTVDVEACTPTATPHIYITKFNLVKKDPATGAVIPADDMKTKLFNNNNLTEDVKEYVRYLPDYSKVSSFNNAQYRIIIEYYRHRFDTPFSSPNVYQFDAENDFKTYATIEVKRQC